MRSTSRFYTPSPSGISFKVFLPRAQVGGASIPSRRWSAKLATEVYDPEDGLIPRSPQLTPQVVTLRPSSSSDSFSSDESSEIESKHPGSKPKRRVRAQASRGDAVLIGFLGGLNHPDLANRAGEEVLPQSDTDSCIGEMVSSGPEHNNEDLSSRNSSPDTRNSVVQTLSPIREASRRPSDVPNPGPELPRQPTPERFTPHGGSYAQASNSTTQDRLGRHAEVKQHANILPLPSTTAWAGHNIHATAAGPSLERERSPLRKFPHSSTPPRQIVSSETGSTNVLAAMHVNPQGGVSGSPNQREELPSLRETGLKPLLDDRPQNINRSQAPTSASNTMLSPPVISNPGGFPSPSSQSGRSCSPPCPIIHPSPIYSSQPGPDSGPPTGSTQGSITFKTPPSTSHAVASYNRGESQPSDTDGGGGHRSDRKLPPLVAHATPPASSVGGYKCTYEGCKAPPFQTQYLLHSHTNVHSQSRPHYCPVPNCSRSEGGKGFKRKNEMIRHGLVHRSPGYVCPFCPEREHRYPRPDNLQRHVRVNHVDKDMNDPVLRQVLSQRLDGGNRGRRRRLGSR